jgi:putative nucleotidyltransferase with HDIG domain
VKYPGNIKITERIESFPSMPGSAAKVLSLINDPEVSASEIEELVRLDPGLTANILKVTNSAYFGLPTAVGSLKRAIVLLGLKRVVQIVTASCVTALMDKAVAGYDLLPGELWRHSIAVSVAAEILVKELNIPKAEEIFTAALLHDVGKLILGEHVKDDLEKILSFATEDRAFQDAEREVLGTDHAEVGSHILKAWSFPQEIVNAVRWHHDPDAADTKSPLLDIVHVSDVLCLIIGIGVGREGLHYELSPSAIKNLGLNTATLELVASQTLEAVNELTDLLKQPES